MFQFGSQPTDSDATVNNNNTNNNEFIEAARSVVPAPLTCGRKESVWVGGGRGGGGGVRKSIYPPATLRSHLCMKGRCVCSVNKVDAAKYSGSTSWLAC